MFSDGIVEAVDIAFDGVIGLGPRGECYVVEALLFQARKEGLGHRIVVTVAQVAHALRHLPCSQHLAVVMGSILATAVAVDNEPRRRVTSPLTQAGRLAGEMKGRVRKRIPMCKLE